MKHIISALVENKPGVLAHVAGMFAARAFNIDSLVVGRTEDPKLSRMTIVVVGRNVQALWYQKPCQNRYNCNGTTGENRIVVL
jgi:acetolactate synthase small subunit